MNTDQLEPTIDLAVPLIGVVFNEETGRYAFHYSGLGYSYVTTRNELGGTECKLHCSREFLAKFSTAVGAGNSTDLPFLLILERENSWWHVTSLRDNRVVARFLKRLNRWSLRNDPAQKEAKIETKPLSHKYVISVDKVLASSQRI